MTSFFFWGCRPWLLVKSSSLVARLATFLAALFNGGSVQGCFCSAQPCVSIHNQRLSYPCITLRSLSATSGRPKKVPLQPLKLTPSFQRDPLIYSSKQWLATIVSAHLSPLTRGLYGSISPRFGVLGNPAPHGGRRPRPVSKEDICLMSIVFM